MLRGGLSVSREALDLAWGLEARGLDLRVADDGRILVGPDRLLDDEDRDAIRRLKPDLIALVRYCEVTS